MKLLTAKEIKKNILGIVLSDGSIDVSNSRFDFYSKHEEHALQVYGILSQITGMTCKYYIKRDKRGYMGYRVTTPKHVYWAKVAKYTYNGRKFLSQYAVDRVDEATLAQIWMCDGYLEHSKNRKLGKVQNIGWLCLEAFPKEELELLKDHLERKWGIQSSFIKKPWGFGYRLRVGGASLQKLISVVYPYILDCFKYKTLLYYKSKESADMSLPSAEQFIIEYNDIEDMIRHSQQWETT